MRRRGLYAPFLALMTIMMNRNRIFAMDVSLSVSHGVIKPSRKSSEYIFLFF
jgi:hypothetical protein